MKEACKNCEYFVQISRDSAILNWGDCTNPSKLVAKADSKQVHAFTWEDKSCQQFKQKQALIDDTFTDNILDTPFTID